MKQVSPIAFRSNLYPLKQDDAHIRSDKDFLTQIRDRKAIAELHEEIEHRAITEWMYKPSEIQEKIYGKDCSTARLVFALSRNTALGSSSCGWERKGRLQVR